MWPGPRATKWGSTRWVYLNDGTGQGGNGKGNKIAIFDTWVQGICAQLDLWRTSPNYRNKRFDQAIAIWSGGNNVEAYIKYVLTRIPGMTSGTIMNDEFWKGPMGLKFLKVQAGHEAGKPIPAPEPDWIEAQRRVFAGAPPKAPASVPKKTAGAVVAGGAAAGVAHQSGIGIGWIVLIVVVVAVAAFVIWKLKKRYDASKDVPAVAVVPVDNAASEGGF
jgi:hypothetical protein